MREERKVALRTLKSIYVMDKLKRSVESDSWGPFNTVNKKNIRCSRQPPRFALLSRVHQSGAKIHIRACDWVRIPQRSSRRSRPALRRQKVSRTRATCPSPHDPSSVAFLSSNSFLLQYLSTVTSTFLPFKITYLNSYHKFYIINVEDNYVSIGLYKFRCGREG